MSFTQSPLDTAATGKPRPGTLLRKFSLIVLSILSCLLWSHDLNAADRTWSGGSPIDNNWLTPLNWDVLPVAGDSLFFGGSTRLVNTNNNLANTAFNGITFNGGAGGFTLRGNAINLAGGITNNSTTLQIISLNLALTGTRTVDVISGGTLSIGGVISGAFGLNKTGVGTLTLSGNNTFTGVLTVQSGTLSVSALNDDNTAGVLGQSKNAVVLGGSGATGTLQLTGANDTSSKKFTMATGGTGVFQIDSSTTTLTLSGAIDGGGSLTKTGAGTLLLNQGTGVNTYGGATTVDAGTLQIANNDGLPTGTALTLANTAGVTFDLNGKNQTVGSLAGGGTTGGLVELSGHTLTVGDSTSTTFAGVLGGSGSGKVTKVGAGTLTLTGTNTYTGITTITGGALNIQNGSALGTIAAGTTVASGAALQIQGGITTLAENLTLNGTGVSSDGALRNISGNNTFSGAITLGSSTRINSDSGTLTLSGTIAAPDAAGTTLTFGGSGNVTASNVIDDKGGAKAMAVTKDGSGTLTLSAANTYVGTTTAGGGVLLLNHTNALPGGIGTSGGLSALTINGGVVGLGVGDFLRGLGTGASQVQFTGSGGFAAYNADRNVNLGGASALVTWGSGNFVPSGSALIFGAGGAPWKVNFQNPINLNTQARTIQVNSGGAPIDAVLSGQLSGTGASALTKTGLGTLSLTASNTYSGGTTVNAGKLLVNNATGSGTGTGSVTVNSGGTLGGTGTISGSIVLNSGGTISAGNSPGKLNTGSQVWSGGATNIFEINKASGTEGTDPGWDLLDIAGSLTITATSGSKFVIDIRSLTLADAPGNVSDFNNGLSYDWRIAKTTGGISGFDATVFELLLAGYSNDLGGGTFSIGITNGNNDLILHFAPVPEASTYVLMGFGLLILSSAWRKRRG